MTETKETVRRIGGLHGKVLTATVVTPFVSHSNLKGQNCNTIHMGSDGGKVILEPKKQTFTPTSATNSEFLSFGAQLLSELDYDQKSLMPEGTPVG